jgi:hypothetical protein
VLAGLVAAAPVLWMTMDVALTGDPLHSVDVTRTYTEKAQAAVSAHDLWVAMRALTGWPVLVGALAGALLAAWRRDRRAAVPMVAGAAVFLATVGPAVAGESPVLRRYLLVPAAVVSLYFAIACLGWTGSRATRAPVRVAGVGLLAVAVALMAGGRADRWREHRRAQATRVDLLEHLRHWATSPGPRSYLTEAACRPILTPGYGYRPYLRLWLDVPPRAVAFHFGDASPSRGLVVLPTAADDYQSVMLADVGRATRRRVLAGSRFRARFRRVARSSHWEMYAEPACRRAVGRDG